MPRRDRVRRRRSPFARWTGRVLGLLGTAALLAVGVVAATMVLSAGDDEVRRARARRDADAGAGAPSRRKRAKPKLTRAQRDERRRAVEEVAPPGLHARRAAATTRPRPPAARADRQAGRQHGARAARVLLRRRRVHRPGRDDGEREDPSRAASWSARSRSSTRCTSRATSRAARRAGTTRVHFRWNGEALTPRETIPSDAERLPPRRAAGAAVAPRRRGHAPGRTAAPPAQRRRAVDRGGAATGGWARCPAGGRASGRAATRGALAAAHVVPAGEALVELGLVERGRSRWTLPPPGPPSACWNR